MRAALAGLAAITMLAVAARAQPLPNIPDVGEQMARSKSKSYLTTDTCVLTFSLGTKLFGCVSTRLVSISRGAESFQPGPGPGPTLDCATIPCQLLFPDTGDTTASLDWIMPSDLLTGSSLLVSWQPVTANGSAVWEINWCTYKAGQPICTTSPGGLVLTSDGSGVGLRTDAVANPFSPDWAPTAHVVLTVTRRATHANNTLVGDAALQALRLEWSQ